MLKELVIKSLSMSEYFEFLHESVNKVSQTVFSNPSPRSLNISLVNDRVYSPLPSYKSKSQLISPKKLRKATKKTIKNIQTSNFKLPGLAADYKELISPFAIRTRDYSVLYSHYTKREQEYVHFPSIRPKYSIFKNQRRLRNPDCPENIASKKQLSVRRVKS